MLISVVLGVRAAKPISVHINKISLLPVSPNWSIRREKGDRKLCRLPKYGADCLIERVYGALHVHTIFRLRIDWDQGGRQRSVAMYLSFYSEARSVFTHSMRGTLPSFVSINRCEIVLIRWMLDVVRAATAAAVVLPYSICGVRRGVVMTPKVHFIGFHGRSVKRALWALAYAYWHIRTP